MSPAEDPKAVPNRAARARGRRSRRTSTPLSLLRSVSRATVGLFGAGALLFGIGLLVLRAHYDFLGITSALSWDVDEAGSVGGRFVLHVLTLPVSWLLSLGWIAIAVIVGVGVARFFAARLPAKFRETLQSRSLRIRGGILRFPLLVLFVALGVTFILLETVWVSVKPQGMLFAQETWSAFASTEFREQLYVQVVLRIAASVALLVVMLRAFWPTGRLLERTLLSLQILTVGTALLLWPVAYGKLSFAPTYHSIHFPDKAPADSLYLIGIDGSGRFVVWNAALRQLEFLTQPEGRTVSLGPKKEISL